MDENNISNKCCDIRISAYKNGKMMEQWREESDRSTENYLSKNYQKSWTLIDKNIRSRADYDELIYKLTLKYLRKTIRFRL